MFGCFPLGGTQYRQRRENYVVLPLCISQGRMVKASLTRREFSSLVGKGVSVTILEKLELTYQFKERDEAVREPGGEKKRAAPTKKNEKQRKGL